MKIEFFTINELNYFKEHCDFTEEELYLLDEKSKGKTLEETGFDINTLKSVKSKIRKALEDRKTKTMTVAEIKEYIAERIAEAEQELKNHEIHIDIKNHINILDIVSSMLDELEQPIEIDTEKYFEQIDKLIDKEMAQHLVDHMKQALKKEIERNKYVRD